MVVYLLGGGGGVVVLEMGVRMPKVEMDIRNFNCSEGCEFSQPLRKSYENGRALEFFLL